MYKFTKQSFENKMKTYSQFEDYIIEASEEYLKNNKNYDFEKDLKQETGFSFESFYICNGEVTVIYQAMGHDYVIHEQTYNIPLEEFYLH